MDKANITKQRIADAMLELLQRYSLEQLTVAQIAEEAGIGKSTFYRHFHDVYDVFSFLFDDFSKRCLSVMTAILFSKDAPSELKLANMAVPAQEVASLLCFTEKDTILMEYLMRSDSIRLVTHFMNCLHNSVIPMAQKAGLDTEKAAFFLRFVAGGVLYSVLDTYRRDGVIDIPIAAALLDLDISALQPGGPVDES